jgi:hypothetical protein
LLGKGGFTVPLWNHIGVVYHGATHWLSEYVSGDMRSSSYHTLNVIVETGNISLTELSISQRIIKSVEKIVVGLC